MVGYSHESWRIQVVRPAQLLRILDFEEKVQMADQNADQRVCAAAGQDQIERQQNPWQVHGLEAGAEPEANNHVLVQLAPDVQHRQDHRVHQQLRGKSQNI